MSEIGKIREKIDNIDNQIIDLYQRRLDLSAEILVYKSKADESIVNVDRENEILSRVKSIVKKRFKSLINNFYLSVLRQSRVYQYKLKLTHGNCDIPKIVKDAIDSSNNNFNFFPKKIGFCGELGAYAHIAAKKMYLVDNGRENNISYKTYKSFEDVCIGLSNGQIDVAVLPIENSTEGTVNEVYDLLIKYDGHIHHSAILSINHCLLVRKGFKLEDIEGVHSHPQALAQCSKFIKKNKLTAVAETNTATAAKKVNESELPIAAIASFEAAKIFNLEIADRSIINVKENSTRFIALTSKYYSDIDSNKCSLVFELTNQAGSLSSILSIFADLDISLSKVQSRPIPQDPFKYKFYVDFEGSINDISVQALLSQLYEETISFKLLGFYRETNHT